MKWTQKLKDTWIFVVEDIDNMLMVAVIAMACAAILSFGFTLVNLVLHITTKNQLYLDAMLMGLSSFILMYAGALVVSRSVQVK